MISATLAIPYITDDQAAEASLLLEQEPVADNSLTTDDLAAMLALVRAGYSAKTYRPSSCPASVVNGQAVVPLHVWAWPSPLELPYALSANQGVLGERIVVEVEREFEVVFDFERTVTLPFMVRSINTEWTDLPCFDRASNEMPRPQVTIDGGAMTLSAEVLAVLRVRCVAVGYLHTLVLRVDKGGSAITDVKAVVSAGWLSAGEWKTAEKTLELPGCVALLLATCDDGGLVAESRGSARDDSARVAVVYYNDCTGDELAVRHERP